MGYVLGARSRSRLRGVHPDLVRTVELAILRTKQDFAVHCGRRTLEEQRRCVAAGTSWTMNSRHLVQSDGLGHAADLVPFADGELRWHWPSCYLVASAMSEAARELGTSLIWGGVWDLAMMEYGSTSIAVEDACEAYVARRRRLGRRAAIDGPHFQLSSTVQDGEVRSGREGTG